MEGQHIGTARRVMPSGRVVTSSITSPASGVFDAGRIRYCRHPVLHGAACVYCGVNTQRLSQVMREIFERDHAATEAAAREAAERQDRAALRPPAAHRDGAPSRHRGPAEGGGGMRLYGGAHGFGLRMTPAQAASMDGERGARLRASRRLVLVLDLDHTLVHATRHVCGEGACERLSAGVSRAGRRASLASVPCAEALAAAARGDVAEVHVIRDSDLFVPPPHAAGAARAAPLPPLAGASAGGGHFIKLRPGVREFLRDAAELFELHVRAERGTGPCDTTLSSPAPSSAELRWTLSALASTPTQSSGCSTLRGTSSPAASSPGRTPSTPLPLPLRARRRLRVAAAARRRRRRTRGCTGASGTTRWCSSSTTRRRCGRARATSCSSSLTSSGAWAPGLRPTTRRGRRRLRSLEGSMHLVRWWLPCCRQLPPPPQLRLLICRQPLWAQVGHLHLSHRCLLPPLRHCGSKRPPLCCSVTFCEF